MTLLQLKYFVVTCSAGSISKASETLFVTQPTISTSIIMLENEFGVSLFKRINKRLVLTKEGEYFLQYAKELLEKADDLANNMAILSKSVKKIRIGVPPMIGVFLFPKIFLSYKEINPTIEFEMIESGSLKIVNRIENKEIDIGITIIDNNIMENYNYVKLLDTELCLALSKNHRLVNNQKVTTKQLENEPLILMNEGSFQNILIKEIFKKDKVNMNVLLNTSQLAIIKKYIYLNQGVAFLMKPLIDDDADLVGLPFNQGINLEIGLVWHKKTVLFQELKDFISYIQIKKYK
ncbi:MAG: LysR family transcriptional regulator [Bacillales bacterium]|jgi:DNA-binding transcriptional LysR family regulator|nr:LysR family transcriptional regulator [Bacillales bacterium]